MKNKFYGLDKDGKPILNPANATETVPLPPARKRIMMRRVFESAPPEQLVFSDMKIGDRFWVKFASDWRECIKVSKDALSFVHWDSITANIRVIAYTEVFLKKTSLVF